MMLTWIISSSLLIAAVIALRFALRDKLHPAVGYALWLVVLLRLLVPFTVVHNPASVSSAVENTQLSQEIERLEYVDAVEHADDGSVLGIMHDYVFNTVENDWADTHTIVDYSADELEFSRWQRAMSLKNFGEDILMPLWYAGIALVAVWFLFVNLRYGAQLRRTRQKLDCDCPRPVYISEVVATPCLYGFFSPAIYVTPAVAADETALRHVLAHELTHYRHRDHIWGVFRAAALALHWYNPLVWYAAALSRRDAELCCDAAAISALGEEQRTDYGRTLIALSCRNARANDLILTATTMTGGKRTLKERISLIARRPQTWAAAAFILAVAVVFMVVLTFTGSAPATSYIRASSMGTGPDSFRLHYDKSITFVRVVCDVYQDGELLKVEERVLPASAVEKITLEPIPREDAYIYDIVVTVDGSGGKQEFIFDVTTGYTFERYGWSTPTMPEPVALSVGESIMLMNFRGGEGPWGIYGGEELENFATRFRPDRSATVRLEFYGDKESARAQGSGNAYDHPLLMAADNARRYGDSVFMACESSWGYTDNNISLYTSYRFGNLYRSTLSVKYYQKGQLMQEANLPYDLPLSRYNCNLSPTDEGWRASVGAYDYALIRATDSIDITIPVSGEPQVQNRSGVDISDSWGWERTLKVGETYCLATATWGDSVSRWGLEYEDNPELIAEAEHLVLFELTVEAHGGDLYEEYMYSIRPLYIHLPPELTTWELPSKDGKTVITGASVVRGGQSYMLTKDEYLEMTENGTDADTILSNRRYWAMEYADYVPERIQNSEYVTGTGDLTGAIPEWTLHVAAPVDSTPESIVSTFTNEQIICKSGALTFQNYNDFAVWINVWSKTDSSDNGTGRSVDGFSLEAGKWITLHDLSPDLLYSVSFGAMVEEGTRMTLTVLDHDPCHSE